MKSSDLDRIIKLANQIAEENAAVYGKQIKKSYIEKDFFRPDSFIRLAEGETDPSLAPPTAPTAPESTPGPGVNTKAQDNDAAGGVTLAAMARTPQGFEAYMGMLPDTRFYAPREIYRGQRVVDNARLQRALSGASDRLHQEIVDQQYKK